MVTDDNRVTNMVAMVAVKANSVKLPYDVIRISHAKQYRKGKLVIDLYYNQRKNVRQIAQEARISFRDIAAILKKKEEAAEVNHGSGNGNENGIVDKQQQSNDSNNKSPNEKATQAYRLFDEGKKPVEVAIQLGLPEYKATKYYREYLELAGLYEVTFLYEEKKHCIPSLLKLNKILEREGIQDENDIANVLRYANELPNLQKYNQNLQNQVHNLKYQIQELESDLQVRRRQIAELTEVENMLRQNIDTLQNDVEHLFNERSSLQQFVLRFKNSNKDYLKIKSIAKEVVDRFLAEQKSLLSSALVAVIEALRMNPDRYAVIYNSKYDNNNDNIFESSANTASAVILSSPSTKLNQNYYYNEYREGILEIANSLLKMLLNQTVDKTMVAAAMQETR